MSEMTRALLALLATLAGSPAAASDAAPADWGRLDGLATGHSIAGPAGWLNWCMADTARCTPADGADPVRATPQLLALLDSVQQEVNGALAPLAEPPGRDLWQIGARSGDCEDYALAKQQRLRAAGLPSGAARLATARLPNGELHAVLAVDTDRGTLVLDNLQRRVVPLRSLAYAWQRAQGTDGTLRWRELAATPAPGSRHARVGATPRDGAQTAGTGTVDQ
jgi:predicted transglutaminase-like cysteine proteinase